MWSHVLDGNMQLDKRKTMNVIVISMAVSNRAERSSSLGTFATACATDTYFKAYYIPFYLVYNEALGIMVLTLLQFKEMDKLLTVKLPPYGPALRVDTTWFENEAMNGVAAIKQRFQELVLTFCFFICACVISSNANAGFNVVLTAVMYVLFVALLAMIFNKKRTVDGGLDAAMAIRPMTGGALIGATTMLAFLSLMTAIYWGQMSGCESGTDITGYSCYDSSGMAAASWFASFLLVAQLALLTALVSWKDDLFVIEGGYENFDAREDQGAYSSSAFAYDGATFGTGGMGGGIGGGGGGNGDMGTPQQADL